MADGGLRVSALISFGLLTVALRDLEVGPAYAVWTGIGAAGAAAVGMIFLGDAVSAMKLASIALILAGRAQPVRRDIGIARSPRRSKPFGSRGIGARALAAAC